MDSTPVNPEEQLPSDTSAENSAPQVNESSESQEVSDTPIQDSNEKQEPVAEVVTAAPEAHDDEHHEEEVHIDMTEESHEELEAEPVEDFGQMSKEDLVLRMDVFSKENDVNTVKNRVQAARDSFQAIFNLERDTAFAAFIAAGGIKEEFDYKDALEEKFFDAYKVFQKRRSEFILGQEKIRTTNLKVKNEILLQMKNILQTEEDMSKAFNEFHELQAKWRGVGPVPPQNVNDLWMTYKLYCDRFYEFIRLNRELQDLEMKKISR
ncbi:MAG: DUF349 domain-containing protein [Bacteroidetes bacterium]|nr:DUF349 domain-containing protein [Bacteroidota bacterium]